ncbi:MAG: type VI secretion system ATPase TssH [Pseudomonadota bacterium]|nr:type VI secretion system ATPase TssH [Pseudomonadota bacterium]
MNHLKVMISRLSPVGRQALEQAARLCVQHAHAEVDIAHVMLALLLQDHHDMDCILKQSQLSKADLRRDLENYVQALNKSQGQTPVFANRLMALLEQAWAIASSISTSDTALSIRTGHIVLALLTDEQHHALLKAMSELLPLIDFYRLKSDYDKVCARSSEQPQVRQTTAQAINDTALAESESFGVSTQTPALDQYTFNLTEKAHSGQIDPVIGREDEIRQMIDILIRRRQNNPILTGEAGVGKTAVVEGLALKISQGIVPDQLKSVQLHVLDMGLLQAGASVKGEFENRLKQVIQEVQASAHPIILFIDEAHTLIGAGGTAGQNDAANLLKPALARGELRTIAATTWAEYKKYFEKDAALARRFQVVKVEEPVPDVAIKMLRAMIPNMSAHFSIQILDEAVQAAVQLSARYITGRQLPDKAIGVLDTAAARVALSRSAQPSALDRLAANLHDVQLELQQLRLENHQQARAELTQRIDDLDRERLQIEQHMAEVTARWQQERRLIDQIEVLQQQEILEIEQQVARDELHVALAELQAGSPMVHDFLDARVVTEVVADWTGIPLGNMLQDELEIILNLEHRLAERVIGQDHALHAIAQRVRTARAQLEDPNRPQGVFLFVGPSGVGKTETALALADALYGGERHLITINMSEYQEAHTVSALKGSPPGYVGYGEGGVLTEAVRRRPYSVVLLDEVEKAHPDVLEMFFQVFDKGWMEDGEGRYIDFKNCLIILTSNIASSNIMQACINQPVAQRPSFEALGELIRPALYKAFKPAFLGRLGVIAYYPMTDEMLVNIIELKLSQLQARLQQHYRVPLTYQDDVVEVILARCTEVDTGARNIDHILNGSVLPELAVRLLQASANADALASVEIGVDAADQLTYQLHYQPASVLQESLNVYA